VVKFITLSTFYRFHISTHFYLRSIYIWLICVSHLMMTVWGRNMYCVIRSENKGFHVFNGLSYDRHIVNIKAKLSVCLIKRHSIYTYGGVQICYYTFLTSVLDVNDWVSFFPRPLYPGKKGPHWIEGWARWRRDKFTSLSEIKIRLAIGVVTTLTELSRPQITPKLSTIPLFKHKVLHWCV
jgi:hypothetical protein